MATPNIQLSAAADTRSPLQKIFSSTNLVLFMVCLMYGLTYIDRINVNTAGPSISHDLHLSTVQLGWVFSAFGWAYLALQVWGGWLSDKFGAPHAHRLRNHLGRFHHVDWPGWQFHGIDRVPRDSWLG